VFRRLHQSPCNGLSNTHGAWVWVRTNTVQASPTKLTKTRQRLMATRGNVYPATESSRVPRVLPSQES
jgi:hypothetical protein